MEEDSNVIDITDRGKLMAKMVGENAVQLVEMGSSGTNYCITLSKAALIALREGRAFPLEFLNGDKKMTITLMRDNTYKAKIQAFKKISEKAKDTVEKKVSVQEDTDLGKSLGEKLDQE